MNESAPIEFEATIKRVADSHLIQAKASATDKNGRGFWTFTIEEPGGRCVLLEVEMTSLSKIEKHLDDLAFVVRHMLA